LWNRIINFVLWWLGWRIIFNPFLFFKKEFGNN
jgi:hypothetical protein